jgi:ABC-2 type transport system ATP-binding protein
LLLSIKKFTVSTAIIETSGLNYAYKKGSPILQHLELSVDRGHIYGFLGPNGSGKTTTLSLLLGLLRKQEGSIRVFGQDFNKHRTAILRRLGSLIEAPSLYGHLTAHENLEVYRRIYHVPKERIPEVLNIVGLQDTGKKTARRFSLGMKQRLSIALALLHRPELLILDEPTNGLDPNGIIELRELLKRLNREEGMTILVSSHILSEVEKMVTHVGIIARGCMLFQGSIQALRRIQQVQSQMYLHTSNNEAAIQLLHDYKTEVVENGLAVAVHDPGQVAFINRKLIFHGIDVYRLQPQSTDLENLFIQLTTAPL